MSDKKDKKVGALVRLQPTTKAMLEVQLARANIKRVKLNKTLLTRGDIVALAIESIDLETIVNS
jgi:hypothetical protein